MARMVRKQIYITKEQDEALKRVAAERGQTEAEVVRTCLDAVESYSEPSEAEKREAERLEALEAFLKRMQERAEVYRDTPPMNERGWTRDEIYEERLQKIMPRR